MLVAWGLEFVSNLQLMFDFSLEVRGRGAVEVWPGSSPICDVEGGS
jgi:hypothetical protein